MGSGLLEGMGELTAGVQDHSEGQDQPIDRAEEQTWELSKHLLVALLFLPVSMLYPGPVPLWEQIGALQSACPEQPGADEPLFQVI